MRSPADIPKIEERSFDETIALYYQEWVLMKVTAFDEHHRPTRGIVIEHSPDRAVVSDALKRQPKRPKDAPFQPYYTFSAIPRVHPGETIEQAGARFEAQRAAALEARRTRGRT